MEADEIKSILGVLDTAAWARTGYTGPTIGEMLALKGHKLKRADKNRIACKDQIHEYFENEKQPGESFFDWLKSKPDSYFKRIELNKGGKVISISDYLKQKEDIPIKKIDLASYFTPGKTLSSLTEAERDVVNQLLRMSLGKKD